MSQEEKPKINVEILIRQVKIGGKEFGTRTLCGLGRSILRRPLGSGDTSC